MTLKNSILDLSRQKNIGALSPFIDALLDEQIQDGVFLDPKQLEEVRENIVDYLAAYREQTRRETVVLGMSGGVDSALTAALFKEAGWRVLGYTLPINQQPEETDRGIEACNALGIEHTNVELSDLYNSTLETLGAFDEGVATDDFDARIRKGNVRARLRMITLYNMASFHRGVVASTDNFSELSAGFWTLHGDVGDVSPIQALLKSWEVPYLAKISGVPESTWRATPTDGLGIAAGDEAQLGGSYLEWDIMVNAMIKYNLEGLESMINDSGDVRAAAVFEAVRKRMGGSWFKRMNPVNVPHVLFPDRYEVLAALDSEYQPAIVRGW